MENEEIERLRKEYERLKLESAAKDRIIELIARKSFLWESVCHGIMEEVMIIDRCYRVIDINRAFEKTYGISKEEACGSECYRVKFGLEGPCDRYGGECPLPVALATRKRAEASFFRKLGNGKKKDILRIIYPLATEGEEPNFFAEVSRDVTEFRSVIKRLKTSEQKFKAILDTATDAILSINEDHRIVLFNNAAQRIFGYSRKEVLDRDLGMLIPPQFGDHYYYVKRFLDTKQPKIMGRTMSLTALRKTGEEFPIELGLSYYEGHGGLTITAIIRDMSRQKELEDRYLQAERLAAVGQTVAQVAHEIKNPLMIIGGFSHQIRKRLMDEQCIEKLDLIMAEVERLEKLVLDLGDFTKKYKIMKRPADINLVVKDVLKIVATMYPPDRYFFEADLAPELPDISCDPDKLKQVFMNVTTNAAEAMEEGGTITVSTDLWDEGVEVRIHDEGVGISEEDRLRIFEPFYTTRKRGSGLGLSISYKIVEAHKGEIKALSAPGQGTTFVIRLPGG
ncbi:MAG TPA: PAS domain-containing sensor histidine kinase [Desulfobacteraceae bacterium]|nr:PAS domain-containing sensor histidine kinase [Desulfobacteraceae bacterium]